MRDLTCWWVGCFYKLDQSLPNVGRFKDSYKLCASQNWMERITEVLGVG